jgi:hypothetical protein
MTLPKFRVWDRLTNKMFPIGIIDYTLESVYIEEPNGLYAERDFDDIELMQSTGKRDSLNNEIFDGDIIAVDNCGYLNYGRVFYSNETASYRVEFKDEVLELSEVSCDYVCGNIFENPELWEEII